MYIYIYHHIFVYSPINGKVTPCHTWDLPGRALGSPAPAVTLSAPAHNVAGATCPGAPSKAHGGASPGGRGGPPGIVRENSPGSMASYWLRFTGN